MVKGHQVFREGRWWDAYEFEVEVEKRRAFKEKRPAKPIEGIPDRRANFEMSREETNVNKRKRLADKEWPRAQLAETRRRSLAFKQQSLAQKSRDEALGVRGPHKKSSARVLSAQEYQNLHSLGQKRVNAQGKTETVFYRRHPNQAPRGHGTTLALPDIPAVSPRHRQLHRELASLVSGTARAPREMQRLPNLPSKFSSGDLREMMDMLDEEQIWQHIESMDRELAEAGGRLSPGGSAGQRRARKRPKKPKARARRAPKGKR